MNHIKIDPNNSYVELIAKEGAPVADALTEAIQFCKDEGVKDCTLNFNGFLFDIEPDYCVDDKIKDYNEYLKYKEKLGDQWIPGVTIKTGRIK